MRGAPLTDLPVKHLEYVFSPPGLPLPVKGDTEQGTTSILVRGGPGAGKTTFALAIAHAIAKVGGGLVLYLTTEFSPVEIAFKATLIGLAEEVVDAWPGTEGAQPGGVVVEHLNELRQGQPVLSSAERRRTSIDAVWGLLHPEREGAKPPTLPVRAVVIDALTLPEPGENEGAQRAEMVAFVQALESEGRSVVLVEELAQGAAAWSAFVVDVVFDLAFVPDPETQELRRKLTLSKCRYAVSIPGPHDYGLQGAALGVWPDLVRVVTGGHGLSARNPGPVLPRVGVPNIAIPMDREGTWAMLGASIVLSPYDATGVSIPLMLRHTPGVVATDVRCGVQTYIGSSPHAAVAFDNEGPYAIGWSILASAKALRANACLFQNLEGLQSRPGWMTPVVHLLDALRSMGYLVCVHGPRDALQSLVSLADLVWGGGKYSPLMPVWHRHRPFARWSMLVPSSVAELLPQLEAATTQERSGLEIGKERISALLSIAGDEGRQAAWFALHTGWYWHAARAALAAIETDDPAPTMLLLWKAICAALSKNAAAITELKLLLASPDEPLILDPLLCGLAGTGQMEEADRIIADVGARRALAPWMLDRLRADARLDSDDPAWLRDAARRLTALTADESLPPVDRAETWFNLGTAHDRLGERDAALAAFEQAATLNPHLDAARDELERLRAPKPASP